MNYNSNGNGSPFLLRNQTWWKIELSHHVVKKISKNYPVSIPKSTVN